MLLSCVCRGGGEVGVAAEAPEEDVAEGVGGAKFAFFHSSVDEGDGVVASCDSPPAATYRGQVRLSSMAVS